MSHPTAKGGGRPAIRDIQNPRAGITVYCSAVPKNTSRGRCTTPVRSCIRMTTLESLNTAECRKVQCTASPFMLYQAYNAMGQSDVLNTCAACKAHELC